MMVSHAGGAVRLTLPVAWRVSELPHGRSVLLMVSRQAPPRKVEDLSDGLWIRFEAGGRPASVLADGLRRDLHAAHRSIRLGEPRAAELAGYQSVRLGFEIDAKGPLFAGPGQGDRPAIPPQQGWRQVTRAPWGVVTVHFVAPAAAFAERQREVERVLATLELAPPRLPSQAPQRHVAAAARIIGSCKSTTARMDITGAGGVTLAYDRRRNFELSKLGLVDYRSPITELRGQFEADADLLRIRWADGSLLNIRWRLEGGDLLITDHHGRSRRLTRLYR
ncbi:MAG: hypothetical protein AAF790_08990 [Planctomycetota bacterium]